MIRSRAGKAPLIILLPGSGPTDKDGNNPLGVRAATYRLLAEDLAMLGFDTVRYDKRGVAASASAIKDANMVTIADYGADALTFADAVLASSQRECVWLAGHSEGGIIALSIVNNQKVCGLILLATPGRPIGDILRTQLAANPANAPILAQANAAIDQLQAGQAVDEDMLHPGLLPLFSNTVQPFLRDLMQYDPSAMIASAEKPIQLIYGGKDIQTPVAEGELLRNSNMSAILKIFPDMNHVLKSVSGDSRAANLQVYSNPDLPLTSGVSEAIADFIKQQEVQ
ncbi:alpha/beta hydrolase [Parasphingorhabdus sp. DH2-15]|uniref:alpha/beta hydrolase n=1 Tax=Parasphingorhabdus sp. DH2-15 TaxID=3444112 RepID=UPI003F688973